MSAAEHYHRLPVPLRIAAASMAIRLGDATKWAALRAYPLFEASATMPIPSWIEPLGARASIRAARHAQRRVPAYRHFLEAHEWRDDRHACGSERLLSLPIMDKQTYIRRYPTALRCLDGRIPLRGTEMDESSGSSGTPFNWVRSAAELHEVHRQLSQFATYAFREPVVTVNCFSMGAWSTGINTAQALRRNGLVKSPGPDAEKVIDTLRFLGPGFPYVITGYPPFLRTLLDHAQASGLDLRRYRLFGVVGGEGMSEQLRSQLLHFFITVYSAYGASDLDIGVAGETPLTIALRQRCAADSSLRRALFGEDPRLPMLFQFNPLDYTVEVVDAELVITVNRLCMLSPRIRYNIHDSGAAFSLAAVREVCRNFGFDPLDADPPLGRRHMLLPLLAVRGRSDSTLSYMGANLYPEDIEQALHDDPEVARALESFCLELIDTADGTPRPVVHVELREAPASPQRLRLQLQRQVVARLAVNSRDYRAALQENPAAGDIRVELHRSGSGPFAVNEQRIKRRYVLHR